MEAVWSEHRRRRGLAAHGGGAVAGPGRGGRSGPGAGAMRSPGLPARHDRRPALWAGMANVGYPILAAGAPDLEPAAGRTVGRRSTTAPRRRTSWTPGSRSSSRAALDRLGRVGRGAGGRARGRRGALTRTCDGRPDARPAGRAHDARREARDLPAPGRPRARADLGGGAAGGVPAVAVRRRRGTSAGFGPRAERVRAVMARRWGWPCPTGRATPRATRSRRTARSARERAGCARGWRARSSTCRARRSERSERRGPSPRRLLHDAPEGQPHRLRDGAGHGGHAAADLSGSLYRAMEVAAGALRRRVADRVACAAPGLVPHRGLPADRGADRVRAVVHPERMAANLARSRDARSRRRTCSCWRPRWAASRRLSLRASRAAGRRLSADGRRDARYRQRRDRRATDARDRTGAGFVRAAAQFVGYDT